MKIKTIKSKSLKIESDLIFQIESLCEVLNTNFSVKTKELLVRWKIDQLAYLRKDAPELFQAYQEKIGNKKGSSELNQ